MKRLTTYVYFRKLYNGKCGEIVKVEKWEKDSAIYASCLYIRKPIGNLTFRQRIEYDDFIHWKKILNSVEEI